MNTLVFEELPQKLQRGSLVAALLDQDIENLALIIDRAPKVHPFAADPHDHLVQMPAARRRRPPASEIGGDQRAKLDHPAANGLPAGLDSALGQQFLNVTNTEREPKIQPHPVADHVRREAMPFERDRIHALAPRCPTSAPYRRQARVRLPAPSWGQGPFTSGRRGRPQFLCDISPRPTTWAWISAAPSKMFRIRASHRTRLISNSSA